MPAMVLIMQIAIGKTNKNKTLYGRVMRHREIMLCPIFAFGLYLVSRFEFAKEALDFSSNKSWYWYKLMRFDVKLLVEKGSKTNTKSIDKGVYGRAMTKTLKDLNLQSNHTIHVGRAVGALTAEKNELDGLEKKNLGNWNPDVMESVYSSKIPLKVNSFL